MKAALFTLFYIVLYVPSALSHAHAQRALLKEAVEYEYDYDWSGFYTGLIAGGQSGRSSNQTSDFGYNADNDQWGYNESGVNAGAELGYNVHWHSLIIGPEIDLGYLGMNGSGAQPVSPGFDTVGQSNGNFYTMFRARAGIDLYRNLIFFTGGAIGVNYKNQVVDDCTIAPCGGSTVDARKNGFVWGYTVGGGVEHLFANGWSAKLECLYFDLNRQNFSGMTNLETRYDWNGHTFGYVLRGGVNYHF